MKVDAHQHFWRLRNSYASWPTPDLAPIYRDFQPDDLAPALECSGVEATILVQAAPSASETDDLLRLAEATPFVAGVVGWVDFAAPTASERIGRLANEPKFVGVRPMVQSISEPGWLLRPELGPAVTALIEHGLAFDGLVRANQLEDLAAFAARHPGLRIVLNHAGKPPLASGRVEDWRGAISRLALCPNVWCKLSGLWTEAGDDRAPMLVSDIFDHLLICFGPQRLMWGSDWPVLLLAGGYGEWADFCDDLVAVLHPAERESLFGGNAKKFYGFV
jgi:L-fuconolactonase